MERAMELQLEEMYQKGMSEEQIEMTEKMMSNGSVFTQPWFTAIMIFISGTFMGAVVSLIIGAIFKGKSPQNS
jgi:cytoskeletal protein CcmA (bactofilin family)